ncbi:hypothetical protein AB1046_08100 [Promicromonospora sp. Populi]|uniref:hypothetical protein n=1 Tax=Promicromonospora sp. Populi TaxID=3239420 RepID=UPI0034E2F20F
MVNTSEVIGEQVRGSLLGDTTDNPGPVSGEMTAFIAAKNAAMCRPFEIMPKQSMILDGLLFLAHDRRTVRTVKRIHNARLHLRDSEDQRGIP